MARKPRWCHGAPVEPTQGKLIQLTGIKTCVRDVGDVSSQVQMFPKLEKFSKILYFQTITTLQGEDIVFLATDVTLPGAVDWVMMQSCFGSHFMLVLEKQEKFDGHVQFFAGNII